MSLAQWCQTHSLKEFFQLMEDYNNNNKKGKLMDQVHEYPHEGNPLPPVTSTVDEEGKVIEVQPGDKIILAVQDDTDTGANDTEITVH